MIIILLYSYVARVKLSPPPDTYYHLVFINYVVISIEKKRESVNQAWLMSWWSSAEQMVSAFTS